MTGVQYVLVRVVTETDSLSTGHPMDWDWSKLTGTYAEAWGVSEFVEAGAPLDELDLYMPDWGRIYEAEQNASA